MTSLGNESSDLLILDLGTEVFTRRRHFVATISLFINWTSSESGSPDSEQKTGFLSCGLPTWDLFSPGDHLHVRVSPFSLSVRTLALRSYRYVGVVVSATPNVSVVQLDSTTVDLSHCVNHFRPEHPLRASMDEVGHVDCSANVKLLEFAEPDSPLFRRSLVGHPDMFIIDSPRFQRTDVLDDDRPGEQRVICRVRGEFISRGALLVIRVNSSTLQPVGTLRGFNSFMGQAGFVLSAAIFRDLSRMGVRVSNRLALQ